MCASDKEQAYFGDDIPVLQAIDVSNSYDLPAKWLFGAKAQRKVLDSVNLSIAEGEMFGLVGESGCGKTTLGRAMLGLINVQGQILLDGQCFDVRQRLQRASKIQAVFQNPASALNPAKKVGWLLEEPLRIHGWPRLQREKRVLEVLELIGLDTNLRHRRVTELSGGQKQRVCIGCALVLSPRLIIADEATSALDVSVAAQILNLFGSLHSELGLSMLFISHNLDVVYYLCDRIAVMLDGRIIEQSTAAGLYDHPLHPYTLNLLAATPSIHNRVDGELPPEAESCTAPYAKVGCAWASRCSRCIRLCTEQAPELRNVAKPKEPAHLIRCHLA
ncbi:MAG: ATP-binding cassette domain-containing protein [Coriobacteriales bacterium]|jgi:oligopeptide/dipeptide ABC transporter ATP-binding protein|nr:ATP-binding cassette domain-containing protein [Coriobacteriales bacterium]